MSRRVLELAGILRRSDILKEEEEEESSLFGDDDSGDKDDEADTEKADDASDTEEADDEADTEKADEKEKDEPAPKLSTKEIAKYGPSEIEVAIDQKMKNIFDSSIMSANVKGQTSISYPGKDEEMALENLHKNSLKSLLIEENEEAISAEAFDLQKYTAEVARLIQHYDTLLDMEGMIFSKAKQLLLNTTDQATADGFEEMLALVHNIDLSGKYEESNPAAPAAVGASSDAAG